jgi:hypothetical protein
MPSPSPASAITHDEAMTVDARNRERPHSGKFAIKLVAAADAPRDGTVSLLAGSADNGDGRKPVDLRVVQSESNSTSAAIATACGRRSVIRCSTKMRSSRAHLTGVGKDYRRFTLDIPSPKDQINTLLVLSVPPGKTVYVDDIRFVSAAR